VIVAPLKILSIGINPSLPSARMGFPFANPRNRFWQALNSSRLVAVPVTPGVEALRVLRERDGIAFTDLVDKPSAMAHLLSSAEFREGAPRLARRIVDEEPLIAWFHGMTALAPFLRWGGFRIDADPKHLEWGHQGYMLGATHVFVTPNPSPANANYKLRDLIARYDELAHLAVGLSRGHA
jgi:TDG/mug DNA glycosylase family protein